MITIHTIVCNEDRFIKAALASVLVSPEVSRALVWDAGSIDKTVHEIKSINDPRIEFRELGRIDRKQLVNFRNEQLRRTKTSWFMLLDGDEIWPRENLKTLVLAMKQCDHETIAFVNRTRNVVGDLSHFLPESDGHYHIGPWTGHLNIRAIKNIPELTVKGEYPNEWYEFDGKKIQEHCVRFIDTWYLHTTHLRRSSSLWAELTTIDRLKKKKWFSTQRSRARVMRPEELPETLRDGDLR